MILLDEHVPASERERLVKRHYSVKQIGHDIGRKGLPDEAIILLLRRLRRPTLVTFDADFFQSQWRHARYCIAWFDLNAYATADHVRRLFRQSQFNTQAKRMGSVLRIFPGGIVAWHMGSERPSHYRWDK